MEFEPDFIEKLVAPINANNVKGTFSKLEFVKNWDNPIARCYNKNNNPPLPDKMRIPQDSDEGDDFRAILKSEFMKVAGFDNTGYTDTWSLAEKLQYKAKNAPGAIYYHYNPDTLDDVYNAAQWIGKRRYKGGKAGSVAAMIRSNVSCVHKRTTQLPIRSQRSFVSARMKQEFSRSIYITTNQRYKK
jgi:hypothetical protein